MLPRPAFILTALLTLAAAASAARAGPTAGSAYGAWIAAPSTTNQAVLYYLTPDATDGVAHVVTTLNEAPIAIGAQAEAAVLVFPRTTPNDADPPIHPVRRIERIVGTSPRPTFSRPYVLAPLPARGDVVAIAIDQGVPIALQSATDPVTGTPTLALHELRVNEWRPVPLPASIDPARSTWLTTAGGRPTLVQHDPPDAVHLWSFDAAPAQWDERTLPGPTSIESVIGAANGPALITTGTAGTTILTIHDARFEPSITLPAAHDTLEAWGAGFAGFRTDAEAESGIHATLYDLDGAGVYDGPLDLAGPVSPAEIQILILLLASIFLTALVFVLRPEPRVAGVPAFPSNASLASPARRALAFLIDLTPGLGIAYLVFFLNAESAADAIAIVTEHGAAPILTVAGVTIALTTVGEASVGRTLGKAVTRCRTIAFSGSRPSWRQALARNTVKVVCPPVALFVALAPAAPHPGSFDTLVIVDQPPHPGDPGSPDPTNRADPS